MYGEANERTPIIWARILTISHSVTLVDRLWVNRSLIVYKFNRRPVAYAGRIDFRDGDGQSWGGGRLWLFIGSYLRAARVPVNRPQLGKCDSPALDSPPPKQRGWTRQNHPRTRPNWIPSQIRGYFPRRGTFIAGYLWIEFWPEPRDPFKSRSY